MSSGGLWASGDSLNVSNLNTKGGWSDPSDITAAINASSSSTAASEISTRLSEVSTRLSTVSTFVSPLSLSSTTGTLAINRGGTGTPTAPADGQLLVGMAGSAYTHRSTLSYSNLPSSSSTWDAGSGHTIGLADHLSVRSSVRWGGGPYISSSSSILAGSSSASASMIARVSYHPASNTTTTIASSTTAAVDSGNISVTFAAPSSGTVYAVLMASALIFSNTDNNELNWGLLGNTASVLSSEVLASAFSATDNGATADTHGLIRYTVARTRDIAVSGTTTWVFAHRRRVGSGTVSTCYGGRAGPAVIEIWAVQ